jgi:hypothetical protein
LAARTADLHVARDSYDERHESFCFTRKRRRRIRRRPAARRFGIVYRLLSAASHTSGRQRPASGSGADVEAALFAMHLAAATGRKDLTS